MFYQSGANFSMENKNGTDESGIALPEDGNQTYTSEYLIENTKLSVMQIIFIFMVGVGGIVSLVNGLQIYDAYDSSGFHIPYRDLWFGYYIVVFLSSAYIIWCFVKRKPNAIHVSKCYLTGLLVSTILLLVMVYLNAEHTYKGSGAVALQNAGFSFFSVFAQIFWLIYLFASEKLDETFPKPFRKQKIIDYVILVLLIGIPFCLFNLC